MEIGKTRKSVVQASVSIVGLSALILTIFSIKVLEDYGVVLFTLVPLCLGAISASLYCRLENRRWRDVVLVSFLSLFFSSCLLLVFKIEGIVCVIMASPILVVFNLVGALIGYLVFKKSNLKSLHVFIFSITILPSMMAIESEFFSEDKSGLIRVETSIVINADINTVWDNVVNFPEIPPPDEYLFKTGLAYPISSRIVGEKENAIRYCEFTTGAFVEPITKWDQPNRLAFDVEEQPVPLKSMIGEEVPGNMYKYFASTKGEFKLKALDAERTHLIGTTWYYHKIRPVAYWKVWSNYIIHSIHRRVLYHIKDVSEKKPASAGF